MTEDDISRTSLPKIGILVADAKAELKLAGIDTEGKRSDEILKMAREERNRPVKGLNRHRGPSVPSLVFDGSPT
jgi:hypothetical protein